MSKYFLNEDVLMALCYFHATISGQVRADYPSYSKEKFITDLNNQLFKDVLIKQPDLIPTYELYVSKIREGNVYPSTLFAEMFANKIQIENFTTQLFTKSYIFNDKDKRKNVFKYLLDKHPAFLTLVHDFITENTISKNPTLSEDSLLYNFYFTALKNNNNPFRKNLNSEEILNNIDFLNPPFDTSLNKKKLNTYILHFPKDMNLYNHIMGSMGNLIKNEAVFKQLWEEKIKLFPKDVQNAYYNENININAWTDRSSYHYKFQVNEEYIVEQSKVSATKAERFGRTFHNALGSIIQNNFNPIEETRTGIPSVSFLFENEEDRERAKKFCNTVVENILFMIKNANYDLQYQEQYDAVSTSLQKMYMTFTLAEDLNSENSKNKRVKTNKL